MDKDAFLHALRDDPAFAAEVLALLAPYLRADVSAYSDHDYYSGRDRIVVSVDDFYAERPR